MRLIRFGKPGEEQPGLALKDGTQVDVSAFGEDYTEQFFATNGLNRLSTWLGTNQARCPKLPENVRLGPPISRPSKIVCIGLNYSDHAKESNMTLPPEPVIFF